MKEMIMHIFETVEEELLIVTYIARLATHQSDI